MNATAPVPNGADAPLPGRPIIVLGMHRSGTSCLAGCLQAAGLHLGEVHTANMHNLKGNRENQVVMDLNDALLAANGGSWHHPPDKVEWTDASRARREPALAAIARDGPWGFKDPRTLLTLDGWLERLDRAELVASYRHPSAVAASLAARPPGFSAAHWFRLWRRYNRLLLALADARIVHMVSYDWSAPVYLDAITDLAEQLRLPDPARAGEFFDDSLRHRAGEAASEPPPEDLVEIYARLEALAM